MCAQARTISNTLTLQFVGYNLETVENTIPCCSNVILKERQLFVCLMFDCFQVFSSLIGNTSELHRNGVFVTS